MNSCNLTNDGRKHYPFSAVPFYWLKVKYQQVHRFSKQDVQHILCNRIHYIIEAETSVIDFGHVRLLLLGHNDKVLKQKSTIQQKKFNNLLRDKKPQHDPEKINFNYSSCILSKEEKSLLLKGLNFNIPLKNLIMLITLSILNYFTEIFVPSCSFRR